MCCVCKCISYIQEQTSAEHSTGARHRNTAARAHGGARRGGRARSSLEGCALLLPPPSCARVARRFRAPLAAAGTPMPVLRRGDSARQRAALLFLVACALLGKPLDAAAVRFWVGHAARADGSGGMRRADQCSEAANETRAESARTLFDGRARVSRHALKPLEGRVGRDAGGANALLGSDPVCPPNSITSRRYRRCRPSPLDLSRARPLVLCALVRTSSRPLSSGVPCRPRAAECVSS